MKERAMDEYAEMASREREAKRIARRPWFWLHAAVFVPTRILFVIWDATDDRPPSDEGLLTRDARTSP
jgi:hypothetical protein